jgi:hypothetical protein
MSVTKPTSQQTLSMSNSADLSPRWRFLLRLLAGNAGEAIAVPVPPYPMRCDKMVGKLAQTDKRVDAK